MSSILNGRRIFAAIVVAITAIAVHQLYFSDPQLARTNRRVQDERFLAAKFRGSDAATESFRSDSKILSRIYISTDSDRKKAAQIGAVVADYGKFVVVSKDKSFEAKNYGLEEQEIETTINLPGARFDPIKTTPEGTLRLGPGATGSGKGYYILQFGGTPTDEWLRSVEDAGVEVLQYVPHQAYFVYADSDAIARVANHSRVRWIGRYNNDAKLSGVLKNQLSAARGSGALSRGVTAIQPTKKGYSMFEIGVFARADLDEFVSRLSGTYAKGYVRSSRLQHNFFNVVRAELRLEDVEAVAAMPDVVSIEPMIPTKNEDEQSAQIVAGNYFNPTTIQGPGYNPANQFGADGTNVTVSVVDDGVGIPGDGGFYLSSLNAANGPLRGAPSGAFGHGHLNATIIAGGSPAGPVDSLFYNYGLGIAPRANILSIPRNRSGYTGTDEDVYNDSVVTPGPNGVGAAISNNSWGNGTNGNVYGLVESRFDGYVQDASFDLGIDPITLVFSAGNGGANGLTRPKAAKNLIAVGNSESLRSDLGGAGANNIDDIAADSSRGPTADGRIKPDVVAPGTAITGGRSGTDSLLGNIGTFHRWSSGTSHSAAQVTGIAALFANWWKATNFNLSPSPALIKAAIINSAVDMNGADSSAGVPNGSEGWGRPNLKNMLNTGVAIKYHNDDLVGLAAPGQGFALSGSVADGTKPIRVTLVWTDPPGVADPALMNNLDLKVTVDGIVYRGNVFSNGFSVPGGTADNRNNVENVFLPAGTPTGRGLSIEVTATALNGDGILNNGDPTDQAFSVVVYNYSSVPPSTSSYNVSGQVRSSSSRGVGMAKVRFTDSQGISREVFTNHFGYFTFTGLTGNQNYTVNVFSKRYSFTQQTLFINSNVTNMVITSNAGP